MSLHDGTDPTAHSWPRPTPPTPAPVYPRLQIDLSVDREQTDRVIGLLDDILTRIKHLETQSVRLVLQGATAMATAADITAKLAKLDADVKKDSDVSSSIETLLTGQTALLVDLSAQLAAAIAGNDPAALQAVADALDAITANAEANTAKNVASVLANTPVGPVDPPVVDPNQPAARRK